MAFFPPSLIPNQTAFLSDDKQAMAGLARRFANHSTPCVVYWPWLSWDGVDISISVQQTAIARAVLIGETGFDLPCLPLDVHGAIVSFGRYKGFQSWELIHRFTWEDVGTSLKKFEMTWWRIWKHGSYQTPDNPLPIEGGLDWASAPVILSAQLYQVGIVDQWKYFKVEEPAAGTYRVEGQHVIGQENANLNLYHSVTTAPALLASNVCPTDYQVSNSNSNVGLAVAPTGGPSSGTITFRVTKL